MLLQRFPASSALSPYIQDFLVQEDFRPSNFANLNPVKVLPTAMTVIGIQYGQPMKRLTGNEAVAIGTSGITGLQSHVMTYAGTGAIGTIIVQLRPGGLAQFTRYPLQEFHNANVPLELVFPRQRVRDMEEALAGARAAAERVAVVQRFLQLMLRDRKEDRHIVLAARQLMRRPGAVSIDRLAADWYMSKRTLERKFNALIGATPKQFASVVRFQHAIRLRHAGYGYLDIVHACGYTDHAHFAKDFKAFAGCTPEQFFRSEIQPELKKTFHDLEKPSSLQQQMYY